MGFFFNLLLLSIQPLLPLMFMFSTLGIQAVFSRSASMVQIAEMITSGSSLLLENSMQGSSSSSSVDNTKVICMTWVMPLLTDMGRGDEYNDKIGKELYQHYFKPNTGLIPLILVTSKPVHTWPKFRYRNYEFEESDIINPTAYGVLKYGGNCASVFVDIRHLLHVNTGHELAVQMIEQLQSTKHVRPHKDYFMFLGSNERTTLQLLDTDMISELRYKYVLSVSLSRLQGQSTKTDSEETFIKLNVINTCDRQLLLHKTSLPMTGGQAAAARKSSALPLFSRRCDSVVCNRHFRVTCSSIQSMIRPDTPSNTETGGGKFYYMLKEASIRYNFTFNVKKSNHNGSTGMRLLIPAGSGGTNGSSNETTVKWVGIVGELFYGEADLSMGGGVAIERHPIADPTFIHTWFMRVFYIKPPPTRTSWLSALWPLDRDVWIVWGVTTVGFLLPMFFTCAYVHFSRLQEQQQQQQELEPLPQDQQPDPSVNKLLLFYEIIDAIYRILMEQAATLRHWTNSNLRLLIFVWTMTCLVLETGYRCKLVEFLSFKSYEAYPKTHLELANSDYRLNFRYYGGSAYIETKASKHPVHVAFMARATLINSSFDCFENVLMSEANEKVPLACLDFIINADYALTKNFTLPGMGPMKELFIQSEDTDIIKLSPGWSFRKGSRWTETFNRILLTFYASGLYGYWIEADLATVRRGGLEWWKHLSKLGENSGTTGTDRNQSAIENLDIKRHQRLKNKIIELLNERRQSGQHSLKLQDFVGSLVICGVIVFQGGFVFVIEICVKMGAAKIRTPKVVVVLTPAEEEGNRRRSTFYSTRDVRLESLF